MWTVREYEGGMCEGGVTVRVDCDNCGKECYMRSFPSDDVDPSDVGSPSLGSQASHPERSLLVGGSGVMAVPWRSMPSVQYMPERGYQMLNQQPNSGMIVGFCFRPRP